MPRVSLIKNVSAVKGKKVTKVPESLQALQTRKTDSEKQKSMSLFDQPMRDKGFEALHTSALKKGEGSKRLSMLDGVQDFNFNNFM